MSILERVYDKFRTIFQRVLQPARVVFLCQILVKMPHRVSVTLRHFSMTQRAKTDRSGVRANLFSLPDFFRLVGCFSYR